MKPFPNAAWPLNGLIKTMNIIDKFPRKVLIEGRSYGTSFALAALKDNTFECVGPLSPCKDYLNDQVFSEETGIPCAAWGYKAIQVGLFKDGLAHIAVRVLPNFGGSKYADQDDH